jgi:hypothetical protein
MKKLLLSVAAGAITLGNFTRNNVGDYSIVDYLIEKGIE